MAAGSGVGPDDVVLAESLPRLGCFRLPPIPLPFAFVEALVGESEGWALSWVGLTASLADAAAGLLVLPGPFLIHSGPN